MKLRDVLPRDAIPSIDDPMFGPEYFGNPDEEVIVLPGQPARAYPIRVLSYHEIVNDTVDGHPVTVTWCPICWSAVAYDRRVDGQTLTFGVSGKLADDALVMYDRETGTEWKQPTGEALAGPMAGDRLKPVSTRMISWERFTAEYPDGVVLQPVRGESSAEARDEYDMGPYERYAAADAFGLYGMRGEGDPRNWDRTDLDAKTLVLGVTEGTEAVGYPRPRIQAAGGVVRDTVGGRSIVVVAAADGLNAFEVPDTDWDWTLSDGVLHAGGTMWDPVTGTANDGRKLEPVTVRRMFAFAWQDAYGPDSFYSK